MPGFADKCLVFLLLLTISMIQSSNHQPAKRSRWPFLPSAAQEASGIRREARSTTDNECTPLTPCGWAVYSKIDKTILCYVNSPCQCPENTHCIGTSDNVQIASYVHRCRPLNQTGQTLEELGVPPCS